MNPVLNVVKVHFDPGIILGYMISPNVNKNVFCAARIYILLRSRYVISKMLYLKKKSTKGLIMWQGFSNEAMLETLGCVVIITIYHRGAGMALVVEAACQCRRRGSRRSSWREGMAIPPSILYLDRGAWWVQTIEVAKVGHDWSDRTHTAQPSDLPEHILSDPDQFTTWHFRTGWNTRVHFRIKGWYVLAGLEFMDLDLEAI